jgi:hypothetical protein
MATNSNNSSVVSVSNKSGQSVEEMLAELKALREQNAALQAAKGPDKKTAAPFIDEKSGRICFPGIGRGGRMYITPTAIESLAARAEAGARLYAANKVMCDAKYAAFAATFADKE